MLVWRKLASAKWENAWVERLAFLGPTRLIIIALPNRKSLRIEAYKVTPKEAKDLVKQFGGSVHEVKERPIGEPQPRKPLAIRDRLYIVDTAETAAKLSRPSIIIPAAMAFGTGEHATTASCLRLLTDLAETLPAKSWDFNDLGTGSGILAIAAKKLGARKVEACDFDPHAVRTAKENVAANHAGPLPVRKTDVLQWTPERTWKIVAANLFSQVLIAAAPAIAAAVEEGGKLILSGILRIQEAEVVETFEALGFIFEKAIKKGKWVSLQAEKSAVAKPKAPRKPAAKTQQKPASKAALEKTR